MEVRDVFEVGIPGAMGTITPAAREALDRGLEALEETRAARDEAEAFAGSTVALQDSAVSTLLGADTASANAARGIARDAAPGAAYRSQQRLPLLEKAKAGWANGVFFADGARVSGRAFLDTAATPLEALKFGFLEVNPAFTALGTNMRLDGSVAGTVTSSGGTGKVPDSWLNFTSSVPKEVIASDSGRYKWRSTLGVPGSGTTTNFGGLRSAVPFTPGGAVMVAFDVAITEVPLDKEVVIVVGWHNAASGNVENLVGDVSGKYITSSLDTADRRRAFAVLPDPGGARALTFYAMAPGGQGDVSTLKPVVDIGGVTMYRVSEVGSSPQLQPWTSYTGTTAAKDVVVNLPAGDFAFIAKLASGEVISRPYASAPVSPATSTKASLRSIVGGSARISLFAFVPAIAYDPRDAEQLANYEWESVIFGPNSSGTVNSFNSHAISRGIDRPANGFARAAEGASPAYSVMWDRWHEMTSRYEVRPGDRAPGDSSTQVRGESTYWENFPYSSAFVTAGYITCDRLDYQTPLAPIIVRQLRYVKDPDPSVNPEFTVNVYPRSAPNTWGLQFRVVKSGLMLPNQIEAFPASPAQNIWDFEMGEMPYVVTRNRFDRSGNGRLEVWLNRTGRPFSSLDPGSGAEKIIDANGSFGYDTVSEFRLRFGLYHYTWDTPRIIRQHKMMFGTSASLDAEALANFPPPRLIS